MRSDRSAPYHALRVAGPIAAVVMSADQLAKQLALSMLPANRVFPLMPPWLTIRLRLNTGGLTGIWQGHNAEFTVLTVAALVLFTFLLLRAPFTTAGLAGMGGIIGGGVSALFDQIRLGEDVQMIVEFRAVPPQHLCYLSSVIDHLLVLS